MFFIIFILWGLSRRFSLKTLYFLTTLVLQLVLINSQLVRYLLIVNANDKPVQMCMNIIDNMASRQTINWLISVGPPGLVNLIPLWEWMWLLYKSLQVHQHFDGFIFTHLCISLQFENSTSIWTLLTYNTQWRHVHSLNELKFRRLYKLWKWNCIFNSFVYFR